jgi:Na+-translocating ferredoxin:NAD+ oxidoreductase RnfD subunit
MKIIRFIILTFYLVVVVPMCAIMLGSLAYGGIVETIKTLKKQ